MFAKYIIYLKSSWIHFRANVCSRISCKLTHYVIVWCCWLASVVRKERCCR